MNDKMVDNTCPICEEVYDDPRLLPCLHTLCLNCCKDILTIATADSVSPRCPLCGQPIVENQLATDFPVNAVIIYAQVPNKYCNLHANQELTLFCETCLQALCTMCQEHKDHDIVPLTESKTLNQRLAKLEVLLATIQSGINGITKVIQALQQRKVSLIQEITRVFADAETRRNHFFSEVNTTLLVHTKMLELQRSELEVLLDRGQATANHVRALVKLIKQTALIQSNVIAMYGMVKQALSKFEQMSPVTTPLVEDSLRFCFAKKDQHNIPISKSGWLVGKSGYLGRNWDEIQSFEETIIHDKSKLHSPGALVITHAGVIVVADQEASLKHFNKETRNFKHISSSFSVFHMIISPDGRDIWASDFFGDQLVCISSTTFEIKTVLSTPRPCGLAILGSGEICYFDSLADCVRVITSTGQRLRDFGSRGNAHGCFASPNAFAVLHTGELVVADTGNNRLQVLSPTNGTFICEIGPVRSPWGVLVTRDNLIIVSESNGHCISVWAADGAPIHTWGGFGCNQTSQLAYPRGLAELSDGRIAVVECGMDRIKIF